MLQWRKVVACLDLSRDILTFQRVLGFELEQDRNGRVGDQGKRDERILDLRLRYCLRREPGDPHILYSGVLT
jgi:hypothetical protein